MKDSEKEEYLQLLSDHYERKMKMEVNGHLHKIREMVKREASEILVGLSMQEPEVEIAKRRVKRMLEEIEKFSPLSLLK